MKIPTTDEIRERWLHDAKGRPIIGTHYEGCWADHRDCVIAMLCDQVDALAKATAHLSGRVGEFHDKVWSLEDQLAAARNERDCK